MAVKSIPFYYDFQSPYSFLAWKRMEELRKEADTWWEENFFTKLKLKPVPMGTLIHSYETKGPAEIPAKRDYLTKVWLRKVRQRGLEIQVPKLPFNSLYALRLATEEAWSDNENFPLWQLTGDFFSTCWEKGQDLGDENVLQEVFQNYPVGESVLERATDKNVRRALKSHLKEAKNQGVFGVPSWVIGEEVFWGEDSFEDFKAFLKGESLYDSKLLEEFNRSFGPPTEN